MTEPTHREHCEREHKTTHLPEPVRNVIYAAAWEHGHAYGHREVMGCYGDLADLALQAFEAGRALSTRQVEAYQEWSKNIAQYIVKAHKVGAVDDEAAAILDGYHVGLQEVAGGGQGEPGETTLEAALRLLKLAKVRGAFNRQATP